MPGELVQLDTVHLRPLPGVERRQFTAVDVVCRCAVLGVRSQATAGTAAAFLDELVARMPFPVQAIQVDGGSEFMAGFEHACQERGIALYVLPPRSPNSTAASSGSTARVGANSGSAMTGPGPAQPQVALRAWEMTYNTERPHQSLDDLTSSLLAALPVSYVSN